MFTFQLRRDFSWRWTIENPVLAPGEPGIEVNTGRFKMGDGHKSWIELDYFTPSAPTSNASLLEHVHSETPHPVYDDGPSLSLLYENAKV